MKIAEIVSKLENNEKVLIDEKLSFCVMNMPNRTKMLTLMHPAYHSSLIVKDMSLKDCLIQLVQKAVENTENEILFDEKTEEVKLA